MSAFDVMAHMLKALDKKPDLGTCDCCGENPGDRKTIMFGVDTVVCDACDEADYRQMRRLPHFRTNDDRDAYEAGVRARGEI